MIQEKDRYILSKVQSLVKMALNIPCTSSCPGDKKSDPAVNQSMMHSQPRQILVTTLTLWVISKKTLNLSMTLWLSYFGKTKVDLMYLLGTVDGILADYVILNVIIGSWKPFTLKTRLKPLYIAPILIENISIYNLTMV